MLISYNTFNLQVGNYSPQNFESIIPLAFSKGMASINVEKSDAILIRNLLWNSFFFSFSGNILRFSLFPWCLKVNENGSWCRYIFHLLQTGYSLNVFNLETQVLKFWENLFYFFNQFFLSVFFVFVVKLLFNQILGLLRRKSNIFFSYFLSFCFILLSRKFPELMFHES